MSKKWTLPALILFLGSTAGLQANPLDSPDIVYIDGLPCNRACQSYLAWSDRALSGRHRAERETPVAAPAEVETQRVEPMVRPRLARHAAPGFPTAPHTGTAAPRGKVAGSSASKGKKIVGPRSAPPASGRDIPAGTAAVTPEKAVGEAVAAIVEPERKVNSEIALLPPTAAGTTPTKANEIEKTASATPDDPDNLVALVLARPEINSLSDLNNKTIAITEKQSASSGRVSAALMAAGAAEVQFSEAKASAIDRLINGEVPAAVVLAPREVANLFPEVEGFRTFRVPLKGRL